MTDPWEWARPIRDRWFSEPLAGRYPLEALDQTAYWRLHEAELRRHFPKEVFFDIHSLSGERGARARENLAASEGASRLADFWVARDGSGIVAMFCGNQRDDRTYRMWHSNVHPAYRRQGLYSEIVRRILGYSRELGFASVVSEHAPSNNAILIAKLKAGFRLIGMTVEAGMGPSVLLQYFHEEAELRAYEFRCGMATLDAAILDAGRGAMPLLVEQIRGAPAPDGGRKASDGGGTDLGAETPGSVIAAVDGAGRRE